jgi:hypothetical protein
MGHPRFWISVLLAVLALLCLQTAAAGAGNAQDEGIMVLAQEPPAAPPQGAAPPIPQATQTPAQNKEYEKPLPLAFGINYALVSDYVSRGINYSEWPRQGEKRPSHQLTTFLEYDTGAAGVFGGYIWFDWYGGSTPSTGDEKLFEVDYVPYWRYTFQPLFTTLELGYGFYTSPEEIPQPSSTAEFYVKVSFDDHAVWGTEGPVLSPFVAYYQDVDAYQGGWLDVGVSHIFELGSFDVYKDTFFKDLTVTPSLTLGADHRYLGPATGKGPKVTRLAAVLYGLDMAYTLNDVLKLEPQYGTVTVGIFLNYSEALERDVIENEFFGGLKVGYAW